MLKSNLLTLRAWSESDIKDIQALKNDIPMQLELMGTPKPNSENSIAKWLKNKDEDDSLVFFVIVNQQEHVVGYIQLSDIDKFNYFGYLGICIDKNYWGEGYAQESFYLLTEYAINILNLRKILLYVNSENLRAISFYNKIGFTKVGLLKEHQLVSKKWQDVLLMEMKIEK